MSSYNGKSCANKNTTKPDVSCIFSLRRNYQVTQQSKLFNTLIIRKLSMRERCIEADLAFAGVYY